MLYHSFVSTSQIKCDVGHPKQCLWPLYYNLLVKLLLFYDYCNCILSPDELLLVECRQPPSKEPFTADSVRGPSAEEIRVATANVAEKSTLMLNSLESIADVSIAVMDVWVMAWGWVLAPVKCFWYTLNKRMSGPQRQPGCYRREKSLDLARSQIKTSQLCSLYLSHCSNYSVLPPQNWRREGNVPVLVPLNLCFNGETT